jgi:hypothetical protein
MGREILGQLSGGDHLVEMTAALELADAALVEIKVRRDLVLIVPVEKGQLGDALLVVVERPQGLAPVLGRIDQPVTLPGREARR